MMDEQTEWGIGGGGRERENGLFSNNRIRRFQVSVHQQIWIMNIYSNKRAVLLGSPFRAISINA